MADCATAVTLTEQMCDVADCYQPLANASAGNGSHVMCVLDSQIDAIELKDLDGELATNEQRCACLLGPGTNTSRRACPEPPKKVTVSLDLGSPIHTPGARPSQCMADKVDTNWVCPLEEGVPSLLTAPSMATHYISPKLLPRITLRTSVGVVDFLIDTGAIASFLKVSYASMPKFRDDEMPDVFRAANGGALDLRGTLSLAVELNDARYVHQFLVASVTVNILGFDFLSTHQLCLLYKLRLMAYRDEWGLRLQRNSIIRKMAKNGESSS